MGYKKIFILIALCLAVGFFTCSKEEKKVEAPKQEQIEKKLVPPKAEVKGQAFLAELTDLKVVTTVNTTSKEITETPSLRGNVKITNISKDILDIQGITLEYLDEAGKSIAFTSGEKVSKASPFWKTLKPEEVAEGTLEATIPRKVVKEKVLAKIEINLVYVPSPLKREILTLPEKISP
jgi:hypothetical protein